MRRTIKGRLDRGAREFETRVHEHEGEVMGIARRDVVTVPPTISIKGAAETMAAYKTRRLPIAHPGTEKLEGIVISRDIINFSEVEKNTESYRRSIKEISLLQ